MKHRKGKWEVRRTSTGFRIASENSTICLIDLFKEYPTEANAKLIAAAPELLEALIFVSEHLKYDKSSLVIVRKAIKKATT